MKRGAKKLEKNDMLSALSRYRQARLRAPEDSEPTIAMSEILSQMQRFEESNRLLLMLISNGNATPECYFGLACNYFGMREYDYAADNLESYLDAEPDGPFALDAEEFLDLIEDDDAMFEMTGLRTDQDYDDSAAIVFSRNLMNAGEFAGAVAELKRQTGISPDSVAVKNQLVIAYYCNGEKAKAKALAEAILQSHPQDNMARCSMALCLYEDGKIDEAQAYLTAAVNSGTESQEELNNISLLQLEFRRYAEAEVTLKKLLAKTPYDENVIHRYGYCLYAQGNHTGAQDCYKRLLAINPADTVAQYYLLRSRKPDRDEQAMRAHWVLSYQVPFGEAFRRLNQLNKLIALPGEDLYKLWREEESFQQLLDWGLTLPEQRVKKSILTLLYTFGDFQAQNRLREFLLHTDQSDDLKRVVFGMLKRMGAPEPYMAYLSGQWISGKVNMLEFPYKLPTSYENVVQLLLQYMVGVRDEECVAEAARIYHEYIESLDQTFPRLSATQELSMAAALEYLACKARKLPVTEDEIQQAYRISGTRLRNAVLKLKPFVGGPET